MEWQNEYSDFARKHLLDPLDIRIPRTHSRNRNIRLAALACLILSGSNQGLVTSSSFKPEHKNGLRGIIDELKMRYQLGVNGESGPSPVTKLPEVFDIQPDSLSVALLICESLIALTIEFESMKADQILNNAIKSFESEFCKSGIGSKEYAGQVRILRDIVANITIENCEFQYSQELGYLESILESIQALGVEITNAHPLLAPKFYLHASEVFAAMAKKVDMAYYGKFGTNKYRESDARKATHVRGVRLFYLHEMLEFDYREIFTQEHGRNPEKNEYSSYERQASSLKSKTKATIFDRGTYTEELVIPIFGWHSTQLYQHWAEIDMEGLPIKVLEFANTYEGLSKPCM